MFYYREYPVAAPLSTYIKKCWVLDNSQNPLALTGRKVLPNGCFNLAIISGQGIAIAGLHHTVLKEGIYFCGQLTSAIDIHLHAYTKIVLVQLYPWAPVNFMKEGLAGTADRFLDIHDLQHMLDLDFELWDEPAILAAVQRSFLPLLNAPGHVTMAVCSLLRAEKGNLRITDIAANMGVSNRYLEKKFREALGITPKDYAGIIRVRSLIDAYQQRSNSPGFTGLALEHGFYDQAHFIKSFAAITRISPGKFNLDAYLLALNGQGI
ncbi:helix-turn-helix transcriptional regulator [Chitinophaga sp. Cy-1792]|uniref:helix-turn-helix transcriptional regulator n=1 Tax=Chitinophaga sp. Cy-1792 TaxID=2608339 RepID=UPI00141F002A|nr:helix-turn-helix transcriptional regulator [Chitinophaga sp. Cy-1792]NIG56364.1 helix-turn-helix transcriptional regulator [Chitinophaga sp. Cy-1792]